MSFDASENNLHDEIAARIADATPDDWEHVKLSVAPSTGRGLDPIAPMLINADRPDEMADATEALLAAIGLLRQAYEAKGEPTPGILFEVTKRGTKRPNYMMSFAYDD